MGLERAFRLNATLIFLALIWTDESVAATAVQDVRPNDVRQASQVYVGRDEDMPLGEQFRIAIQPTRSRNGILQVPTSIVDALREIRRSVPHWFLSALKASSGDQECSVVVNGIDYNAIIQSWVAVNWIKPGSPIRNELQRVGANMRFSSLSVRNAFGVGLCQLVKTDNEDFAVEFLIQNAKVPLVE